MPHLTGYESDDEWARKTDPDYGREWRKWGAPIGMTVGCLAAGAVALAVVLGDPNMPAMKGRLIAGGLAVVGLAVGGFGGQAIGSMMDGAVNPRARRRRQAGRAKKTKRGYRLD